jgi:hypothetical protein
MHRRLPSVMTHSPSAPRLSLLVEALAAWAMTVSIDIARLGGESGAAAGTSRAKARAVASAAAMSTTGGDAGGVPAGGSAPVPAPGNSGGESTDRVGAFVATAAGRDASGVGNDVDGGPSSTSNRR